MVGKVVARMLQERLHKVAEDEFAVWFQEGDDLCGHDLHCASADGEVTGAEVQHLLHLLCT